MGRVHFGEAIYLLLTGELPSPSIGRLMDAMLVSFIDHGATPPSTLARATRRRPAHRCAVRSRPACWDSAATTAATRSRCRQLLDEGLALARTGQSLAEAATVEVDRLVTTGRNPAAGLRPSVPHDRSARDAAAADRARARTRSRARAAHSRARARAHAPSRAQGSVAADQRRRRHRGHLRRHRAAAGSRRRAADHLARARPGRARARRAGARVADARDRSLVAHLRRALGAAIARRRK